MVLCAWGLQADFRRIHGLIQAALFQLWGRHFQNTCMHVPGLIIFCDSLNIFLLTQLETSMANQHVRSHGYCTSLNSVPADPWHATRNHDLLRFLEMCLCTHRTRLASNFPADPLLQIYGISDRRGPPLTIGLASQGHEFRRNIIPWHMSTIVDICTVNVAHLRRNVVGKMKAHWQRLSSLTLNLVCGGKSTSLDLKMLHDGYYGK